MTMATFEQKIQELQAEYEQKLNALQTAHEDEVVALKAEYELKIKTRQDELAYKDEMNMAQKQMLADAMAYARQLEEKINKDKD